MTDTSSPTPHLSIHESWIDSFRGVSILAVLAIHILPRIYHPLGSESASWYFVVVVQRLSYFAVPGFLMLSTMVNASSLLRSFDPRRYARSRFLSVVWPYLVWSVIYILWQARRSLKPFDWSRVPAMLWYGKAWDHLYFMVVLIQLLALLPLLLPLLRKRYQFDVTLTVALILTLCVYAMNRYWLKVPNVGSVIFWYTPMVAIGVWMGANRDSVTPLLRRAAPYALILALGSLIVYVPSAVDIALRHRVRFDSFIYQVAEWTYMASVSLLVMWLCNRSATETKISAALGYLGRNSLQIYLAHPLFLALLDKWPHAVFAAGAKGALILYVGVAIAAPLALSEVARKLRVSPILFGR